MAQARPRIHNARVYVFRRGPVSARGGPERGARELANVWPRIPAVIAGCIRNAFHGRLRSADPQRGSRFAETVMS